MKGLTSSSLLFLLSGVAWGCAGGADRARPVQVVEGTRSAPPYRDARVAIVQPPMAATVTGAVTVRLDVTGVEAGVPTPGADARGLARSPQGQHVHLILDNEPYQAIYDVAGPIDLGALDPGTHVIRAFPARQWHESVKTSSAAFALAVFSVGTPSAEPAFDPTAPLLTYSRPKGTYQGAEADSVLLDFYVTNAVLGTEAYRVHLLIDDVVADTLTQWVPYFLVGLEPGRHQVTLELLGPEGAPVPGPFNRTTRVIEIVR